MNIMFNHRPTFLEENIYFLAYIYFCRVIKRGEAFKIDKRRNKIVKMQKLARISRTDSIPAILKQR